MTTRQFPAKWIRKKSEPYMYMKNNTVKITQL